MQFIYGALPLPFSQHHHFTPPFSKKKMGLLHHLSWKSTYIWPSHPPPCPRKRGIMGVEYTQLTCFRAAGGSGGIQHKAVHLALSTLGLWLPLSGPGFMGSFSASPLIYMQLIWKVKVKLNVTYWSDGHHFGTICFLFIICWFMYTIIPVNKKPISLKLSNYGENAQSTFELVT